MTKPRSNPPLTQQRLRQLFRYNANTGRFTWKVSRSTAKRGDVAGRVYTWRNGKRYRHIQIDGLSYAAHRLAFFWMTGCWPLAEIDHKDGDGANNRWENLRLASSAENKANSRIRKNSTTGFKGAQFHRRTGRYDAAIKVNGRNIYLGRFHTPEDAHLAYIQAAMTYFGEYAKFD
jgi:hypothetical protein